MVSFTHMSFGLAQQKTPPDNFHSFCYTFWLWMHSCGSQLPWNPSVPFTMHVSLSPSSLHIVSCQCRHTAMLHSMSYGQVRGRIKIFSYINIYNKSFNTTIKICPCASGCYPFTARAVLSPQTLHHGPTFPPNVPHICSKISRWALRTCLLMVDFWAKAEPQTGHW